MSDHLIYGCYNPTTGAVIFDDTMSGCDGGTITGCYVVSGEHEGKIKVTHDYSGCSTQYYACYDLATGKFKVVVDDGCCLDCCEGDRSHHFCVTYNGAAGKAYGYVSSQGGCGWFGGWYVNESGLGNPSLVYNFVEERWEAYYAPGKSGLATTTSFDCESGGEWGGWKFVAVDDLDDCRVVSTCCGAACTEAPSAFVVSMSGMTSCDGPYSYYVNNSDIEDVNGVAFICSYDHTSSGVCYYYGYGPCELAYSESDPEDYYYYRWACRVTLSSGTVTVFVYRQLMANCTTLASSATGGWSGSDSYTNSDCGDCLEISLTMSGTQSTCTPGGLISLPIYASPYTGSAEVEAI